MSGNVLDFYILRELPIQISFVKGDNLCKQFGPRSGLTECQPWSGSKMFDTQID